MGRITTPSLKLRTTKIMIKVNKNEIDLCNYNLPEKDEFVTKVIRVMIKFNKGVVIRPILMNFEVSYMNLTVKCNNIKS
jgi:hypothetical protein